MVNASLDRRGSNPLSTRGYNWSKSLRNLMVFFDLHDVWRVRHPTDLHESRLDMFWISSLFLTMVLRVDILPFFRSDHSYVYLELSPPVNVRRGKGLWKLNTKHLSDPAFSTLVNDFWISWQLTKPSFSSLSAWWDAGKACLRHHIRAFSRSKAAKSRCHLSSLQNTLFHLNRRASAGEDVQQLISNVCSDIEIAHRERDQGARLPAHIQWAEEGEAPSAYFFRLEMKRARQRVISSIRNLAGVIVSTTKAIALAWLQFYTVLFTAQTLNLEHQRFFLDAISQRLSEREKAGCEGELSIAECKRAVDAVAPGKSPGLDGFPAEFYKRFWPVLGNDFVDVINFCHRQGRLSPSQRSGVITLLHKRGDRLAMQNWRPITFLYVDYKIASKAIANRLLTVIAIKRRRSTESVGPSYVACWNE